MRYPAGHKDKTRAQIVEEATRTIRADGLHCLSVAIVMTRAGLTHGGFYGHFSSKDGLVEAAITTMFAEADARLDRAMIDATPADGLAAYIDDYLSDGLNRSKYSLCPIVAVSAYLPHLPDHVRDAFDAGVQRLTERLAGHIRALGARDAGDLASAVLAALAGACGTARAVSDPTQTEAILVAARSAVRQLLDL
jgi:TetR/AcrR family transcriptional regulator, transcriptional repressor for nem operon